MMGSRPPSSTAGELVEGQADPVVRHPPLGIVIGPDRARCGPRFPPGLRRSGRLLGSPASSRSASYELGGAGAAWPCPGSGTGCAPAWHSTTGAGGLVDEPHGGGGLVDVLASRAAGAGRPASRMSAGFSCDLHRLHLRQHGHGGGGGVDPAAGLRLRHPLDPVDAALELQPGVGARRPSIRTLHILHAAQLRLVEARDLRPPAPGLRRTWCTSAGESRPNRAPSSPPTPARISRITLRWSLGSLGRSRTLELLVEPLELSALAAASSSWASSRQLRVVEERLRLLPVRRSACEVGPVRLHHRLELPQLPVHGFRLLRVAVDGQGPPAGPAGPHTAGPAPSIFPAWGISSPVDSQKECCRYCPSRKDSGSWPEELLLPECAAHGVPASQGHRRQVAGRAHAGSIWR